MEIRNASKRPLKVPLPAGKKLFMSIGGTAQLTPKAAEHPPVKKLIDDGDIEITDAGRTGTAESVGRETGIQSGTSRPGGASASHRSGDR